MKVLFVNSHNQGGAARACLRLIDSFESTMDFEGKILLKTGSSNPDQNINYNYKKWSNIFKPSQFIRFLRLRKMYKKISSLPKTNEPFEFPVHPECILSSKAYAECDIVNLHWVSDLIDYESFFSGNSKPVFWTLHDMEPFSGGYHYKEDPALIHYNESIEENLLIKIKACSTLRINVISPSKWLLNIAKESPVFKSSRFYHIPNGIDRNDYFPIDRDKLKVKYNLRNSKPIILFIAESIDNLRKGFGHLLKFLELNSEKYNCIAIGQKPSKHFKNIIFTGRINDDSILNEYYNLADVFVIPSIEDNLPNTVLESLFAGTPVAGFKIGGIPEMITNMTNGYLSENVSHIGLQEAIENVINGNFNRSEISKTVISYFDIFNQQKRYYNLFKKSINDDI